MTSLDRLSDRLDKRKLPHNLHDLRDLFYHGAAYVVRSKNVRYRSRITSRSGSCGPLSVWKSQPDSRVLRHVVMLPARIYTEAALDIGQEIWTWIADARPDLEPRVVSLVLEAWSAMLHRRQGLFNQSLVFVMSLCHDVMSLCHDEDFS